MMPCSPLMHACMHALHQPRCMCAVDTGKASVSCEQNSQKTPKSNAYYTPHNRKFMLGGAEAQPLDPSRMQTSRYGSRGLYRHDPIIGGPGFTALTPCPRPSFQRQPGCPRNTKGWIKHSVHSTQSNSPGAHSVHSTQSSSPGAHSMHSTQNGSSGAHRTHSRAPGKTQSTATTLQGNPQHPCQPVASPILTLGATASTAALAADPQGVALLLPPTTHNAPQATDHHASTTADANTTIAWVVVTRRRNHSWVFLLSHAWPRGFMPCLFPGGGRRRP